jgi:hypothetical protein
MAIESSMVEITSIFLVNCQVDSKLEASVPTPEAAAAPEVVVDLRVRRDAFLTPPHPPHPARPKAGPRPAPATTEALCRDKRPVLALYSCSSLCTRTHSAQVGWLRYAPYPLVLLTPGSLMRVIFDPPPSPRRLADPSPLAVLPGGWRCCAQLWVLPGPSGPVAVSRGGRQPLGEARP